MSKGIFIQRALKKGLGRFSTNRGAVKALRKARRAERRSRDGGFLSSFEWRKLRMEVLKRDGARCACCGATPDDGLKMHVDHIKPRSLFADLELVFDNMQVLCRSCNSSKSNRHIVDYRESYCVTD